MKKNEALKTKKSYSLYEKIKELHTDLDDTLMEQYQRSIPFNDELNDRWDRAKKLGFGEGTSIYDSSFVFGKVKIGKNCWIGPFTILDGSGNLAIGNHCTISVGVHIYTHDNVMQTLSSGKKPIEREGVTLGNNVYVGPNAIIAKKVTIGDNCVIGAYAFVNKNIPPNSIVFGQPAKIAGKVSIKNDDIKFTYL